MLRKGQPPLSILKLRFPDGNYCRFLIPARQISMLVHDAVFYLYPFLASTLRLGVWGCDRLKAGLSLSSETSWGS